MQKLLVIAAGGALGALCRYGLAGLVHRFFLGIFPLGTLVVNVGGCLAIGFLWQYFESFAIAPAYRSFLFIGFLGAFTTFSTYGLESLRLLQDGELRLALLNFLANNIAGLAAVMFGTLAARALQGN